jgi:hypothetical protein
MQDLQDTRTAAASAQEDSSREARRARYQNSCNIYSETQQLWSQAGKTLNSRSRKHMPGMEYTINKNLANTAT